MTRRLAPRRAVAVAAAVAAPVVLTVALVAINGGESRDYVFLYLAVVAVAGVSAGLLPALAAAGASSLVVDYFFVAPVHTLTVANRQDVVNLLVFFSAAGVVGGLGSRRRRAELTARALAVELGTANTVLERRGREQAEAAEVAVRLARVQQQVSVLEEGDRARRELLANVSHELRTPLATILTQSTGVLEWDQLPPELRGDMEAIASEARRLNRLVGDMLDMSRIEGGALDLRIEPVDLDDAVELAVARLGRTVERAVEWRPAHPGMTVAADWDRLAQVLDNLLRNADAAAPPGTELRLEGAAQRGTVTVRILDHGPGIDPAVRDRVFERFVRGGDARSGGTGLGLAIVRGLVEAQGGTVWVEAPAEGFGECVAFTLPVAGAGWTEASAPALNEGVGGGA